jgi:hypothetical protein
VLSKKEEKQLRQALSRTFLEGYPNPDRRDCPGYDVLRAIASGKLTLEEAEPWIQHLSSCSPCTQEFSQIRKNLRKRTVRRFSAIAATVVLVISVLCWIFLRRNFEPVRLEKASLDLTGRGTIRGPEENPTSPPLQLPKADLDLTVYLPLGSAPGNYDIQVVRESGQPLWSAQGEVKIENYKSTLHVRANLSHLTSGLYLLAIRPRGWDWTYYPLVLK